MNNAHRKNLLLAFLLVGILIFSPHTLAAEENMQCFTPDILAEFDGQDDTPGYIALDGRVYDISKIWKDGTHAGHEAGTDLTEVFSESPHDKGKILQLEDLKLVGYYVQEVLTEEMLAEFNGQDGKPAYVAVNGIIYDVTNIWKDGTHAGHEAGSDITDAFPESPHDAEKLQEIPVIGVMVEKIFTTDELAKYDGKNGEKGYVAVNGIVYDITEIWKDGSHAGHEAGNDITEAAYEAPHGLKPLAKAPIVGIMK